MARKRRDGKFWEHIKVTESGCWEWQGSRTSYGYGNFKFEGRSQLTHRVAFKLTYGYLPEVVCHHCDNPPCCNPAHLFGGTHQDNSDDKIAKGRAYTGDHRGELSGQAKLTADMVRQIRALYASGNITQKQLAERFGISRAGICSITRGKNWKHV